MRVMMRSVIRVHPGKMEEATELEVRHMAIAERVLGVSPRVYHRLSGGGDTMRTIVVEAELDSLAAFEGYPERLGGDPEMQELAPRLGEAIDTVEIEFYIPVE